MSSAPPPSTTPNNPELLIWALYLLGGSDTFVDVEDLFIKSFELAPARLSWRTRQDIPDYKKCSKALQEVEDHKRSQLSNLFEKNGPYKRKLSSAGVEWATNHAKALAALYSEGVVPSASVQEDSKMLRSVTESAPFEMFLLDDQSELNLYEISDLFRCLPDADFAIWTQRFDRIRNAATRNGNTRVLSFVERCSALVKTKGDGK
jgi:hypothetical protein